MYLATGIDDEISGILTGIVIDLERVCFNVWVWCWEDPFDFDFGSGSGGGGGNQDFLPTWQEEYDRLRFCEGVNDIFDTGPDNPSLLHLDPEFCTSWMDYKDNCLATEPFREVINTWAELLFQNPSAFSHIVNNDPSCNGGGLAELILDFPGLDLSVDEMSLLLVNYDLVEPIRELLQIPDYENNLPSIIHILLGTTGHHQVSATIELITDINDFLAENLTPINSNELISNVLFFLVVRGENENVSFSEFEDRFTEWESKLEADFPDGQPLNPTSVWALADTLRRELREEYPEKRTKIDNWFACRVLGVAFEKAVLSSLGFNNFESNNVSLPGMTAKPDGYHSDYIWITWGGRVHTITEVKGVFSGSPPFFDYSGNHEQLTAYLDWLSSNAYQGTGMTQLYLVLPDGVFIDEDLIDEISSRNVHLIVSTVEFDPLNPNMVQVSKPVSQNINDITLHESYFENLIRRYPVNGLYGPWGQFDYEEVDFLAELVSAAQEFENSYLIGNSNAPCPEE